MEMHALCLTSVATTQKYKTILRLRAKLHTCLVYSKQNIQYAKSAACLHPQYGWDSWLIAHM